MSSLSRTEIQILFDAAISAAATHTDIVLRVPAAGGDGGLASCVHLDAFGRKVAVSCHHVLRDEHVYFTGPVRNTNTIDESKKYQVSSLPLIASDATLDLAVFDAEKVEHHETGKQRYSIASSDWFTAENLAPNGTASFLYGLWAKRAKGFQYPDGLVTLDAPMYAAMGPVVDVAETSIVADMAEVEFLKVHERFSAERPTGGVRDLYGVSGSGLWMFLDKQVCLVGIVLGRKDGASDQHLIRVTPVWALARWLREVLA